MVGAVCAIEGLRGAVAVVNGSTACKYLAGSVVEMQDPLGPRLDPRWPGAFGQTRVPCTNIDQEDVIFGMAGKVEAALREVHRRCRPRLMALVNTCAAAAIGEDLTGLAAVLEEKLGCSIIIIDAPGFLGDAAVGWQRAMEAVVLKTARPMEEEGGINIIGPSLLHGNWANDLDEIRRLLARCDIPVNAILGAGSDLAQVESLGRGLVNVVLAPDWGLGAAKLLEERLGLPFLKDLPLPYGIEGTDGFLRAILAHLGRGQEFCGEEGESVRRRIIPYLEDLDRKGRLGGAAAALFGRPSLAIPLGRWLYEYLGVLPVVIGLKGSAVWEDWQKEAGPLAGETRLLFNPHPLAVQEAWAEARPDLIFGSALERPWAPGAFIEVDYPMQPLLTMRPFLGYRGVLTLVEEIYHALMYYVLGNCDT
jgi:light-independent protochlorophyllide reductase B subunit